MGSEDLDKHQRNAAESHSRVRKGYADKLVLIPRCSNDICLHTVAKRACLQTMLSGLEESIARALNQGSDSKHVPSLVLQ